jgi:hypothetical protein
MIVLAASVVVELLTNGALADSLRRDLLGCDESPACDSEARAPGPPHAIE